MLSGGRLLSFYDNNLLYAALCIGSLFLQFVWVRLVPLRRSSDSGVSGKSARRTQLVFCVCIALAVSTLFRLFPGNHRLPTEDSSVFLYIGQQMKAGKVPYLDLFDHKGPVLYFIEYLGVLIAEKNFTGVWILEVLNILATVALMLKLGQTAGGKRSSVFLSILVALGACGWKVWQGGNFTEEYALPWITLAAVIFTGFFQSGRYRRHEIFLLGAGFSIVFLLRANMISAWAAWMPIVLIILIRERRYRDILDCLLYFLGGAAFVVIPVLLVAGLNGFLGALWRDYILFNLTYTETALSASEHLQLLLTFCRVLWPGTAAIVLTLLLRPRNRLLWLNAFFFAVSLFSVSMSGRGYYHYAIVLLPAFILPLTVLFDITGGLMNGKEPRADLARPGVIVLTSLLILAGAFLYRGFSSGEQLQDPVALYIREHSEKNDDILVLGNSCWYYLEADRKTENRYFYQLPPAEICGIIYNDFIRELGAKPSKLVLLPGQQEQREAIDIALRNIRGVLFSLGYRNEIFEEFEVFVLTDGGKADF